MSVGIHQGNDTPEEVQMCLSCPLAECVNCVHYGLTPEYYTKHPPKSRTRRQEAGLAPRDWTPEICTIEKRARGGRGNLARLNAEEFVAAYRANRTRPEMAAQFLVSLSTIHRILTAIDWPTTGQRPPKTTADIPESARRYFLWEETECSEA